MKSPPPHRPMLSLDFGIASRKSNSDEVGANKAAGETRKAKIVVVDEDPASRRVMLNRLGVLAYAVEAVSDAQSALDSCALYRPDLVIVNLPLKGMDGLTLLKTLKGRWPQLTVIIVTAHGSISEAVKATQCGAFGYLVRPLDKDELSGQVGRALAASAFTPTSDAWRANIVARSQLMQDRLAIANRAAASDESILLTGDQGTGKELLARAIHAASARRANPFVVVSCSEAPQKTLACQLFGRGFGGSAEAESHPPGAWQSAKSGTLLIDDIDRMPVEAQAMLLKALTRERASQGKDACPSSPAVRLICTTSGDLRSMVETGAFIEELHNKIGILPIEIPPLGRRREDIPLLVSHFLEQAVEPGGQKKIYSRQAIELLTTSDWPGNVRQLFDLVRQNIALCSGRIIDKDVVQRSLHAQPGMIPTYGEARAKFSRDYLEQSLKRTDGNVTQAARLAKRTRADFYKLLARFRLNPNDFKSVHPNLAGKRRGGEQP